MLIDIPINSSTIDTELELRGLTNYIFCIRSVISPVSAVSEIELIWPLQLPKIHREFCNINTSLQVNVSISKYKTLVGPSDLYWVESGISGTRISGNLAIRMYFGEQYNKLICKHVSQTWNFRNDACIIINVCLFIHQCIENIAINNLHDLMPMSKNTSKLHITGPLSCKCDGLVQERHNSSALAIEIRFSCTNSYRETVLCHDVIMYAGWSLDESHHWYM